MTRAASLLDHLRRGIADGGSVPMRGSRSIRTTLRTLHVLAIAIYYGGHVYGAEPDRLLPALVAVLISGSAFMAFEVWRSPIWLVELRGAATYLKVILVLAVYFYWDYRVLILTVVLVVGVVVSHMPGRYRYYSLLHRRPAPGGEKG